MIWELEPGARLIEKVALPEPTDFDPPDQLDAFLDAVRGVHHHPLTFETFRLRSDLVSIEKTTLDPVVRAIQMPRVSLLIADDVGLGMTIEAGLEICKSEGFCPFNVRSQTDRGFYLSI